MGPAHPLAGTGKSELINAMLERPAARTSAFSDATRRVRVVRGNYHGIRVRPRRLGHVPGSNPHV